MPTTLVVRFIPSIHREVLTQIDPPNIRIAPQLSRCSSSKNFTFRNDVRSVRHGQSLPHIVVGNQYPDPAPLQPEDDLLQIEHCNRIDSREWFVKQDERGLDRQASRNLHTPA